MKIFAVSAKTFTQKLHQERIRMYLIEDLPYLQRVTEKFLIQENKKIKYRQFAKFVHKYVIYLFFNYYFSLGENLKIKIKINPKTMTGWVLRHRNLDNVSSCIVSCVSKGIQFFW